MPTLKYTYIEHWAGLTVHFKMTTRCFLSIWSVRFALVLPLAFCYAVNIDIKNS